MTKIREFLEGSVEGYLKIFDAETDDLIFETDNKVVDNGAVLYTRGLSQTINKVGFGSITSGNVQETTSGMDSLQSADAFFVDASVKVLSGNKVTFEFLLKKSQFNGKNIREYGLFFEDATGNRTMFSRVARTGQQDDFIKNENISVRGEWSITLNSIGSVPKFR